MDRTSMQEEYLEKIWYMKEASKDSIKDLENMLGDKFDVIIVRELSREGLIQLKNKGSRIAFTPKGKEHACHMIRSHRLAERMVHDVLGGDFEAGACEFEHIVTPELVDSICTLLGHPRECPHGMPIPEGECCKALMRSAESSVISITELEIGQSAKVAYVNCRNDQRLHKMDGLHIRPGSIVKLHQTYPAYVIECENANIAIDEEIAASICVWRNKTSKKTEDTPALRGRQRKRRFKGRFFRRWLPPKSG